MKDTSFPPWAESFLAWFRESGNVRRSCEYAGVSRNAVVALRKRNPMFAIAYQMAQADFVDTIQEVGIERAKKSSDDLLKFFLRAGDPETYGEKKQKPTDSDGADEDLTESTDGDLERIIQEGEGGA